jgi:hypothetical protein
MSLDDKPLLGISLGTSLIGIAVIRDDRLLHWQVRKFKGAWSPKRSGQILTFIAQFVRRHEIRAIAVKVPTRGYLSHGLIDLATELGMYASVANLDMRALRIHDLKQFFAKKSLNRKEMMHSICERFPFLERTYQKELANRKAYHVKMFEAILAAICLQSQRLHEHERNQ